MKAQAYIKSVLANRQRYFPDREMDEVVEMIKQGAKDGKKRAEIALEVHRYLGHCYVETPFAYFKAMVTGVLTHININEGIIQIKKEVKNSSNVIAVRK